MPKFTLNSLHLSNYRSYSKTTNINFGKRITLLFGKGSVGKSTIIDAIQTLHASEINGTDLLDKNHKFIVSKNKKSKKDKLTAFNIGFSCMENEYGSIKSILKTFEYANGIIIPRIISLFSNEDDKSSDQFSEKKRYLRILAKEIPHKERSLKNYYMSIIDEIDNKNSWKELYEYTIKYKKQLKIYLNKILVFAKTYSKISEDIKKAINNKQKDIVKKLQEKKNIFFEKEFSEEGGFSPVYFPMTGRVDKYIQFIEKVKSFDEFVKFITDDIKLRKKYIYKNNNLYTRQNLIRDVISEDKLRKIEDVIFKAHKVYVPSSGASLAEFLCLTLTELCIGNLSKKKPSDIYPAADKDHFKWDHGKGSKVLSPHRILALCNNDFSPLLKQIKTIRHKESINEFIKSLSLYSTSATRASDFNELVMANIKKINKWLKEFEYDFKISVDQVGMNGETEIFHYKNGFKIPADLGGSGAGYLLTYLTELLDSEENTILLEEPEKALHASLQIKLSKLFAEISEKNQLVIETHSENLLLGLLKEIRDKNIDPKDVSVLYVYMEDGISKIDQLELNEKGGFKSKWRDGFFTEKLDLL